MKLRYTSLQRAVLAVEEPASPHHEVFQADLGLEGAPVLIGELHSMLPVAAAWLQNASQQLPADAEPSEVPLSGPSPLRIAYVMSDGGALPIAYSRHVECLRSAGWLAGTVTYGHAYGGDLEAVNKYTALLAARHVLQAEVVIVTMGPGIVGTETPIGHTGAETAELIHAVKALGGRPVVIPRLSGADRRARHYGLSHHQQAVLGRLTLTEAVIPLPGELPAELRSRVADQLEESGIDRKHEILRLYGFGLPEVERRLRTYPAPVTSMGRGLHDDPAFFAGVCAAAEQALRMLRCSR